MIPNFNKTCGILGGGGLLGRELVNVFTSAGFKTQGITRENYSEYVGQSFDVFINANGNSKKFWANQHPEEDYVLNVESVKKSLKDFKYDLYVYISSSDVYTHPGEAEKTLEDLEIEEQSLEPYGLHKYQGEKLVRELPKYLIIRPCAMLGEGLKKGMVKDALEGVELFVTQDSQIQFVTTKAVSEAILTLLEKGVSNEVFNCAGVLPVSPLDVFNLLNKEPKFRVDAKKQEYFMSTEKVSKYFSLKNSNEYLKEYIYEYAQ